MNADIKAEWVNRLRSGEYEQGRSRLRTGDKYCCLGVLCEIAVENGVIPEPTVDYDEIYRYGGGNDNSISTLPETVVDWAGLGDNTEPTAPFADDVQLSVLNDNGCSFEAIANKIEDGL